MAVRKIRAGRVGSVTVNQFVGEQGTIFYEDTTGEMRISDGATAGGIAIGSGGGGLGLTGATGPRGFTGNVGATGLQGNIGLTGATGPGSNIAIYDEGNLLVTSVRSINFVGATVTANVSSSNVTVTVVGNNNPLTSDRLTSGNAQVILNSSGPEPYVLFPAATNTSQLQISEAELSSVAGNLTLTSAEDAYVITNGSGAAPGGSKNWKFDRGGNLTLPNNAVLKDTATNSISFGRAAGDSGQGNLTVAIGNQAGEIGQGLQSTAVGSGAGNYNQGIGTVAIGSNAGAYYQGLRAVAVGVLAGAQNQGEYAVALGNFAGGTNQPNNSIVINASGVALNGSASGLFIDPIREVAGTKIVYYNPSTKEVTTGPIGLTSNNNVSITSDTGVWTFNTSGNLVLPNNTEIAPVAPTGYRQTFTQDLYGNTNTGAVSGLTVIDLGSNAQLLALIDPTSGFGNSQYNLYHPITITYSDLTTQTFTTARCTSLFGGVIQFGYDASTAGHSFPITLQTSDYSLGGTSIDVNNNAWKFSTDGNLVLPQTAMDVSPAPTSWPGITFSDGTFQKTAFTGSTDKVDILNTNGLSTVFYPTFVENRTSGQTIRADVDLTYRSDDNLLRSGNIQVGRNIYGSTIGGISDAIQLRPDIDIDKRFLFKVDSISGNYVRSSMEMPVAEVDKAVTLAFTHNNGNSGFIYIQGSDSGATDFNDAFNIMMNSGNVKISALSYAGGNKVWNFATTGQLVYPDGSVQTTAFTGTASPNNISNEYSGSSVIVVGGVVATRDQLSVRIVNNAGALDVEVNYNPLSNASCTAFRNFPSPVNLGAGVFLLAASNTSWSNYGNLAVVGDTLGFTFFDHSFHKIYRVTVSARSMPGGSVPGDAYCIIEELK